MLRKLWTISVVVLILGAGCTTDDQGSASRTTMPGSETPVVTVAVTEILVHFPATPEPERVSVENSLRQIEQTADSVDEATAMILAEFGGVTVVMDTQTVVITGDALPQATWGYIKAIFQEEPPPPPPPKDD